MKVKAEYIWVDNYNDTNSTIRCKTKILPLINTYHDFPIWDESIVGDSGELIKCQLKPARVYEDTSRGSNAYIVLCEVMNLDGTPHFTNFRHILSELPDDNDTHIGFEQEYILIDSNTSQPIGFPTNKNFEPKQRGDLYCGLGPHRVVMRNFVEEHLDLCLNCGIDIVGVNSELMIGQWEYQIGHTNTPISSCDDLIVSRFILERLSEKYNVIIQYKAIPTQNHFPFCHVNFSTKQMLGGIGDKLIEKIDSVFSGTNKDVLKSFGEDNNDRFGGTYTPNRDVFDIGINDKKSNINVILEKNYIEDRRPPANVNPYKVSLILMKLFNKIFN